MKYFSCFSGIGGFELGIQNAIPGAECVGFSEIDKFAIRTYLKNFPNHKPYGSITDINTDTLPDFDCLVGGFPCQSFSIAGKRGGFADTRGTLFFELARILENKKPSMFCFENVKGLLSHDSGRTFAKIIETLTGLGYCVQWQVLNSKSFGVPQNRERVFIIGHIRDGCGRKVFPIGESDGDIESTDKKNTGVCTPPITTQGGKNCRGLFVVPGKTRIGTLRTHKDGQGFREIKEGISPTIPARAREDGSGQPCIISGSRIRRLTPIECERLQGFPDNWTEGVSETQRYKQLGNAVTVNVIEAIFKFLKK